MANVISEIAYSYPEATETALWSLIVYENSSVTAYGLHKWFPYDIFLDFHSEIRIG
jgi:hypothetical protein